jgi:hypothetical protein
VFSDLFSSLVGGARLGAAMETFNDRYTQLAAHLHSERTRPRDAAGREDKIAFLWTASTDARNYVVIGDPAARLGSGRQQQS